MAFLFVKNSNNIEDNRAKQTCQKTPSISSYQGKFACQSMVILSLAAGKACNNTKL